MSKTNHQRGTVNGRQKGPSIPKRHKKNPLMGRPLTGSVHECDYPPRGWNSRIRQRENLATKKLAEQGRDDE